MIVVFVANNVDIIINNVNVIPNINKITNFIMWLQLLNH